MRTSSLVLILLLLFGATPAPADHHEAETTTGTQSGPGSESEALRATSEPTAESTPEPGVYTTQYYFPLTRDLADSSLPQALALPLLVITIPVDILLLPAAAIAGFL
jgi:hypothetical protein